LDVLCYFDALARILRAHRRRASLDSDRSEWNESWPKRTERWVRTYLASVAERDIDLLLMEEFHASKKFVKWFCREVGLYGISPADAWHSVSDTDGESDLLVRVLRDEQRIGILIENKIAAPEQDRQAERYHIRGIKCREYGGSEMREF